MIWHPGVIFEAMATLFERAHQVLKEARETHRTNLHNFVEEKVMLNARLRKPIFHITPVADFGFFEIEKVLREQGLPYMVEEYEYDPPRDPAIGKRFVINLEGGATAAM